MDRRTPALAAVAWAMFNSATAAPVPETAPAIRIFPDIGEEAEVEIGEAMVLRESLTTATSLLLREEAKSEKGGGPLGVQITLLPGVYPLERFTDQGRFYRAPDGVRVRQWGVSDRVPGGIVIPVDPAQPPRAYQGQWLGNATAAVPDMKVEVADQSGFRRELIYGGVAQGVVSISYREFIDDLARPAFTQDLKYDLSAGKEIGFRGARVEILQAGNTSVRFKLLKPLDEPTPSSIR